MSIIARSRNHDILTPARGASIDQGHPIGQGLTGLWLMNESGSARSLVNTGDKLVPRSTPAVWTNRSQNGDGFISGTGTGNGLQITTPSSLLRPPTAVTLLWRGVVLGALNDNGAVTNPALCGLNYSDPVVSPYCSYVISRCVSLNDSIDAFWNDGTTFQSTAQPNVGLSLRYMTRIQFVLTINCNTATMNLWDGCTLVATSSAVGATLGSAATGYFTVGAFLDSSATNTNTSNSVANMVAVWNRALLPQEVQSLYAEPYQFLIPRSTKQFFDLTPPAGTPVSDSDTATVTESESIQATLTDPDVATVVDAGESIQATLIDVDIAAITETESIIVQISDSDSATITETDNVFIPGSSTSTTLPIWSTQSSPSLTPSNILVTV